MKHSIGKTLGLITLFLSLSENSVQAVTSIKQVCPDKFVGTVTNVGNSGAPSSPMLSKLAVNFDVTEVISGEVSKRTEVEVLKHGPHHFEEGESYKVELKHSLVCSIQKI